MADGQKQGMGNPVALRERYLVYPGAPVPECNNGEALAFQVQDRKDEDRQLFALVVRPGYPARIRVMRAIKDLDSPGLMNLVEWGVIDWPPASRKVMVAVYEKPLGGRVAVDLAKDFPRLSENDLQKKVIGPIIQTLRDLRARGITHRAIRPTNMFWASPAKDRLLLGDCCTAPSGLDQPVVMETIESGMTDPTARGDGYQSDDYYALGVSLLFMILGKNPLRKMDNESILRQKIYVGTFGVLVGEQRFSLQIIELMRGLLLDDPDARWDADALELWENGKRATPLMAKGERRAARSFPIGGKEHYFSRDLAMGLAENWDQGKSLLMEGKIELWVRRSLDQKEKATSIGAVVEAAAGLGEQKQSLDLLLARVCLILDPSAPIRYKGLSLMPGGIGSYLAIRLVEGKDIRLLAEMIMRDAVKVWIDTRPSYDPENLAFVSRFNSMKRNLERGTIGSGMERVLYENNDSMPCVSSFLVNDYVLDARDLLPALEASAKTNGGKGWPVDRHIAAFIAARANFDVEDMVAQIAEPKPTTALLAMLNLLAALQWRFNHGPLPALTAWLGGLMKPVIDSYHGREIKKRMEKELPSILKDGSLVELTKLVDNPDERMHDATGYEQARQRYSNAENEIRRISEGDDTLDQDMIITARQVAALISVGISLATVSLLLMQRLV